MARGMLLALTMVSALAVMAPAASMSSLERIYVSSEDFSSEDSLRGLYERWYALYRRGGDPEEKEKRFSIFKVEAHTVYELNEAGARVKHHLNWFADMTQGEYDDSFASCSHRKTPHRDEMKLNRQQPSQYYADKLPVTVDWRTVEGVLTRVKHQGECGSCWAIAATDAMESVHFLENKKRTNLSAQELVDCNFHNDGCKGGTAVNAFIYVINYGIHSSEQFPYVGRRTDCVMPPVKPVMAIRNYYHLHPRNEKMLMETVAKRPVVVLVVGANTTTFKHYSGGIFRGPCGIDRKHEALLVGYGTTPSDDSNDPGVKYWVLRNSWGESWGENGYMRLERGNEADGGLCGIMEEPVYPAHPYAR
ncbi:ervatamin-B-like [Lolium perenne]|uniref:ervatamin-B-like n=1 Tax=Lolium perenne TaxID=4522 RepID=UPI0021F6739C|nr:ervatamin-B-like [Lolium perenne]